MDPHEAAAKKWEELEKTYKEMDQRERVWIDGFTSGLLFVQAAYDVEGGMQTIKTHLPDEWYDTEAPRTRTPGAGEWKKIEDLEKKIEAVIKYLDDGMIIALRFLTEERTIPGSEETYEQRVIEVGGSEGHFGMPEWD
jgi:hypothetical protein